MCRISEVFPATQASLLYRKPKMPLLSQFLRCSAWRSSLFFSNHFFLFVFLNTNSVFLYVYLLPGLSTSLSVLLFGQSLMPPVIPSQAIKRKWTLTSAANATDQLNLNFIYTVRLNLSIFDAFCWLTFRRERQVWTSRVWPSGGRIKALSTLILFNLSRDSELFPLPDYFLQNYRRMF